MLRMTKIAPSTRTCGPSSAARGTSTVLVCSASTSGATAPLTASTQTMFSTIAKPMPAAWPRTTERPLGSRSEQRLAEDGDQDVRRVDVEDDPDQRPQQRAGRMSRRAPRQVHVREVLQLEVREGERRERQQQPDVDRGDDDRRGDGRVQRAARQEVEADQEQHDHPGRRGQRRRIGQGRRDPDVEDQQDAEREGGQHRREDGRAGASEVVGDHRADERVAVPDAAAAGDDFDHRDDRDQVDDPERHDQRDARAARRRLPPRSAGPG